MILAITVVTLERVDCLEMAGMLAGLRRWLQQCDTCWARFCTHMHARACVIGFLIEGGVGRCDGVTGRCVVWYVEYAPARRCGIVV